MIENDLKTEEDFKVQSAVINRIIKKLVKDAVLISLVDEEHQDPTLVAHPDYIVDEELDS